MRLGIGHKNALVESGQQKRCAGGLSETAHISAIEFDASPRTGKGGLARRDLVRTQSNRWAASRNGDGSARNVASPMRHFRSEEHTSELQSRRDLVCRLLLE